MQNERIAVIGLGYVGPPLAVALSRKFDTIGFDVSERRVEELRQGSDSTNEISSEELRSSSLQLSADPASIAGRTIYIVTVPTLIDERTARTSPRSSVPASWLARRLRRAPSSCSKAPFIPATEEICGPALERSSGLQCGVDFKLGYSPEANKSRRQDHPLEKIVKVVAGQDEATLQRLSVVYGSIIEAGIHGAPSIKVAEAAKVIENTQRDVNIALMNEISKICELVGSGRPRCLPLPGRSGTS